jgi:hypothetical protein
MVGVNVMRMLQVPPPFSVLGLIGQFPPAYANGPLTEILSIVSATLWTFVRVTVSEALVVPST